MMSPIIEVTGHCVRAFYRQGSSDLTGVLSSCTFMTQEMELAGNMEAIDGIVKKVAVA